MSEQYANEIWRAVVGAPLYEVSDHGRVRRSAVGKGTWNGRVLAPLKHNGGYLSVNVKIDGKFRTKLIHRLVIEAFIGPFPKGKETNHIDCDKTNNHLSNLEVVTPAENQQHMLANGCRKKTTCSNPLLGEKHQNSKLTNKQVIEMRRLYATGMYFQRELGEKYGVCQAVVGRIVRREMWTHI